MRVGMRAAVNVSLAADGGPAHTEPLIVQPCAACQTIDRADGTEDGWLIPKLQHRVKNANRLVDSLKRSQDRAADKVTSFAGSLNFVGAVALTDRWAQ